MEFNDFESKDTFIENEFFVIDSNNLDLIDSRLYGYVLTDNGILFNENISNSERLQEGLELNKDGAYVWVKRKDDTINIYQDFIGSYGLYLFREDDYFAISNSFLRLVEYLKENHHMTLNYDNAHTLLSIGLCSLSYSETLVNEIKMLPRDYVLKINTKTRELSHEVLDFMENTVSIDSKEGIAILDKWFFKWINIFQNLEKNDQNISMILRGGLISRIIIYLVVVSGINLDKVAIRSLKDSPKARNEYYSYASEVFKELGFVLNLGESKDMNSFLNIRTPLNNSFYPKLGFHKQMFFNVDYSMSQTYTVIDNGGNCIGDHEFLNLENLINNRYNRAKNYSVELAQSLESSIKNSAIELQNRYGIEDINSKSFVKRLYKDTECRNHFGRWSVENYLSNRITLNPLLDSFLFRLKVNTEEYDDRYLLIAVILTRYFSKFLKFDFEDLDNKIDKVTLEHANKINNKYPFNFSPSVMNNNQNHTENSNGTLNSELNNERFSVDGDGLKIEGINTFIEEALFSESFKNTFKIYFSPIVLKQIFTTFEERSHMPLEDVYGAIAVLKIIDDINYSWRGYDNKDGYNWLNHFLNVKEYNKIGSSDLITQEKLLKYITARFDLLNYGNEDNTLTILENSDIESDVLAPQWLKSKLGQGIVVHSKKMEIDLKVKCVKKGEFNIFFRGIDFHDKQGVRVPIFIDFTKFVLNGASIFDSRVTVSHDSPYRFIKENVEDGEIIDIHIEWEPFDENSFFRT